MKLRWFINVRKYNTWDSRWDMYQEHTVEDKPVLQYSIDDVNWIDVPTIVMEDGETEI